MNDFHSTKLKFDTLAPVLQQTLLDKNLKNDTLGSGTPANFVR